MDFNSGIFRGLESKHWLSLDGIKGHCWALVAVYTTESHSSFNFLFKIFISMF